MARLLVSVRSPREALAAVEGGADIIDVKEPKRGPLGRADSSIWREVREILPPSIPLSVALGEIHEWPGNHCEVPELRICTFWKLGLASSGTNWAEDWRQIRRNCKAGPGWIAVAYADWEKAASPHPDEILEAAIVADDCVGVLVDTWDKSSPSPINESWTAWFDRGRELGLTTALAGRLDLEMIRRLAPLRPTIIAVRGAACVGGDRQGEIDAGRVSALTRAAKEI